MRRRRREEGYGVRWEEEGGKRVLDEEGRRYGVRWEEEGRAGVGGGGKG